MPIYAYKCESCGHRQDVLQKMSDPVLSTCPACGEASFAKQLTAAGFQLKGSGWYATDFRGDKAAPADDKGEQGDKREKADKGDAKPGDAAAAPAAAATPAAPAPASDKPRPSSAGPG